MYADLKIKAEDNSDFNEVGYIGKIPMRNIWLLMLYASNLFPQLDKASQVLVEENPDNITDLVAKILSTQVEQRKKVLVLIKFFLP